MLNRKIKKLVTNPKLFFSDMMIKHSKNINYFKPKKINGNYQFTVISAVYNVGHYLDDYFKSLTSQRLYFKNHIHLILVDDGSIDNSADIIKKWKNKYPKNITYIKKENGGQASARNLGLDHVNTEWVTFIDPDDIVDQEYFHQVDLELAKKSNNNICLVSCNLIFYFEDQQIYKDSHPLKFRFDKGNVVIPLDRLRDHMQLSVNSAFFKFDIIQKQNIRFGEQIKPNFEDAHFAACYLAEFEKESVAFIKSAKYYYRKRSDGSSTLDTAWKKTGLYSEVLKLGCVDAMQQHFTRRGHVPYYIQRTVLYHLSWYFKRLINKEEMLPALSPEQKNEFLHLLFDIFNMIDKDTIMKFNLSGFWFFHKVGLLHCFKSEKPEFQISYIDECDLNKNLICIRYFTGIEQVESIVVDGMDVIPVFEKTTRHDFVGLDFVYERKLWFKTPSTGLIKFSLGGENVRITFSGKVYYKGIRGNVVYDSLGYPLYPANENQQYCNAWLLMDRDTQADDNAEHLYRYINEQHPEQPIYFTLRSDSHDWTRLSQDNFNLIEFGSSEHETVLKTCSKVISSHADRYVTNYLGPKMLRGRHFVFLQHGVIMNNISNWLNNKEQINCLITSTQLEYDSICGNNSQYKFSKKEVALTGLPRHDKLLTVSKENNNERIILIMPTWRSSVVGKTIGNGNERELNPEFMYSDFAIHWSRFLRSPELKLLAEKYDYKIIFFPHANIKPYLEEFHIPEYIMVMSYMESSIQNIFSKAKLMITDYSSVAFDMAVQGKGVIYYQFDENDFFSGAHTLSRGYFDYRRDGFGPVVAEEKTLLSALSTMLHAEGQPAEEYQQRIASTFPYRDGHNCQRTYEAIVALDAPLSEDFIDIDILVNYAKQASQFGCWSLAVERWQKLETIDELNHKVLR